MSTTTSGDVHADDDLHALPARQNGAGGESMQYRSPDIVGVPPDEHKNACAEQASLTSNCDSVDRGLVCGAVQGYPRDGACQPSPQHAPVCASEASGLLPLSCSRNWERDQQGTTSAIPAQATGDAVRLMYTS
jgi:hypothetical protein